MRHPFEAIPLDKRRAVLVPCLILTLVVMGALNWLGEPLKTKAAPWGIVSLELAGDAPTARDILDSWDPLTQIRAGVNLGLDFLFLFLYSTTIGLVCVWVAGVLGGRRRSLALLGLALAWGQWVAALLDVVENVALLVTLLDAPAAPWPQIAWWCAVPKFGLVLLGLIYVLLGLALRIVGTDA